MAKRRTDEKVLDVNASMQGDLTFGDPVNLRINGNFKGTLNTKGRLEIGENAYVNADIHGEIVSIAGRVNGNIVADNKLKLLPTASVQGDIVASVLEVEQGAVFQGRCKMVGETMGLKDVSRYLDVEEDKVLEWASSGKIPGTKKGNSWIFEKQRVEDWVKTTQ
jgi:excisionase family DNA binding protein